MQMEAKVNMPKRQGFGHKVLNGLLGYLKDNMGILVGFGVLCGALAIMSDAFLTPSNIMNVLRQATTNANLAIGLTLALIINGIDLSVGPILAISGTLTSGLIANNGVPIPIAILIGITLGTSLGFVNGKIISKTGIPPFIVTLAMMQIARGAAYVYTNGMPIRVMNESYNFLGNGYLGPIPLPIIYTTVLMVSVGYILTRTKLGRHIYAVGGNIDAARYSGINIAKVQLFVYTLSGFLAAFSGIILCARMYSGQPSVGTGYELDAIAASVLGGTSFTGGVGKIGGTLIGVLVISVLNNGLNLMNVNSFWQLIAKGIVILVAVYFDMMKKKAKPKTA
ncbi:MAG: rbsC [Clostridia bacterium]|jgi:ribose transport system permease protein|nr:rbsC [Clostridia bacterium]